MTRERPFHAAPVIWEGHRATMIRDEARRDRVLVLNPAEGGAVKDALNRAAAVPDDLLRAALEAYAESCRLSPVERATWPEGEAVVCDREYKRAMAALEVIGGE